jgi:hypothetical protein
MNLPQIKKDTKLRDEALGLAIERERIQALLHIKQVEFCVNYKTDVSVMV